MRILQVSDLHFGNHNSALQDDLKLRVKALKPNVIVATGDLVDTPDNELFAQARTFLDEVGGFCQVIDGSPPVIAIPGNHDLWDLGLLPLPWRPKFSDFFGNIPTNHYFRNEKVWIWGFDSASKRKLATGEAREDELVQFHRNYAERSVEDPAFVTEVFKIALIHHHPLPVNWDTDWQQRLLMMTNAGTFLSSMLSHRIDLVLHGHEHLQGRARLSSALGGNNAELVVISLGASLRNVSNPARNWFNVISLGPPTDPAGRSVIVESVPSIGLTFEQKGEVYVVQSEEKARKLAFNRWKKEAGFLYCDVTSITDLNLDGDCHRVVECEQMEILADDTQRAIMHKVELPHSSGYFDLFEVNVPSDSSYLGIYGDEPTPQPGTTHWAGPVSIHWGTGVKLQTGDRITYQYAWWALNSFALDDRQFRMKHAEQASLEFTHFPVVDPIRDLLVLVRFPKGFVPASKPQIRITVIDKTNVDNRSWLRAGQLEQELRDNNALRYIESLGLAALRVHMPFRGYYYGIEWKLPEKPPGPSDGKVQQLKNRLLRATSDASKKPFLQPIAKELGQTTLEELLPGWADPIEVICMFFDDEKRKLVPVSAASISKSAHIPLDKSPVQFDYGVGIAGRAFKGNEGRLYLHSEVKNQKRRVPNHYYRLQGEEPHNVLMCLPLRSPKIPEHVFGILNISSTDPDCPLRDTASEAGPISEAKIGDFLEAVNDCVFNSMQALEKAGFI